MLKNSFFVLFLALLVMYQSASAQADTQKPASPANDGKSTPSYPSLKKQADEMGEAFLKSDYEKFTDYMYPKLVETAGGREKFIATLASAMKDMESSGFQIAKYEVGNPIQTIEVESELFSVLPTKMAMKVSKTSSELVNDEGALLAVSADKGANWKFVRIDSKESLKALFPNVVDKLKLPATIAE